MEAARSGRTALYRRCEVTSFYAPSRRFRVSTPRQAQGQQNGETFRSRLRPALKNTKIKWYPIPVGVGIGFLGLVQFYRVQAREKKNRDEQEARDSDGEVEPGKPKKRKRIRPSGPWY